MKLKKRLASIHSMVSRSEQKYNHIWDTCCDHGHLGFNLLAHNSADSCIHFVDIVPKLMQNIEERLVQQSTKIPSVNSDWRVHCLSTANLPINQYAPNESHLVIIAGVGGELLLELVQSLLNKFPNHTIDFILCPVHHTYHVRQGLINSSLGLIEEKLILENHRFYEIIWASQHSNHEISAVGDKIWLGNDKQKANAHAYLDLLLQHYQRMKRHNSSVNSIIKQYQALKTTLLSSDQSHK